MTVIPEYVIVTPARNEAQFIESTLQSVIAQTVRPLRWVIVSDGSTDATDEIVARYSKEHPWIELYACPLAPNGTLPARCLHLKRGTPG